MAKDEQFEMLSRPGVPVGQDFFKDQGFFKDQVALLSTFMDNARPYSVIPCAYDRRAQL